jgi:hypothetical protein
MAVSQRPFDPYRAGVKVYRAYRAGGRPGRAARPTYNLVHSVINVCGACFESAGRLVNSTIHRIWTFVGNVSYEEASSNCLRGCPRLV